jgi:hypothetical protein
MLSDGFRVEWNSDLGLLEIRSILGDARNREMQKKLNLKIKYREGFRPFAPSVLIESSQDFFDLPVASPYMLLIADVNKERRNTLPDNYSELDLWEKLYFERSDVQSITHLDFSARIQTVHKETNPRYWQLINTFKEKTGYGIVVNTSFNVRGEPMVCTTEDAYKCFMRTEMDYLVVNNFFLKKTEQPDWENREKWMVKFKIGLIMRITVTTRKEKIVRAFKILAINFIVLLILLLLIDPFLNAGEKTPPVKRSIILKEHPPNIDEYWTRSEEYMENDENLKQKLCRIRTDDHGFIVGPSYFSHKNNSTDLIFFGGSTTECKSVDEELRFPYLVGELLVDKRTKMSIKSLNGGVSANHSLHSTLNLLAKGINLQPKVILFMHNVNDLILLTKTGSYWLAPETRSIIQITQNETTVYGLAKNSANLLFPNTSRIIWRKLKQMIGRNVNEIDEWQNFRQNNIEISYNTIEERFEQSVKSFISISRIYNFEVVLMTQFNRFNEGDLIIRNRYQKVNKLDYDTYIQYYKGFNEKLREIALQETYFL